MSKRTILLLGARSDIAMAVAHRFAKEGYDIYLAARQVKDLTADKSDIELRYQVTATQHEFDALDVSSHSRFVDTLPELPSVAVCAVGLMGEQKNSERDAKAAVKVLRSNFEGPASIMAELADRFEKRGSGTLVGISSVAGERGRQTNYIYGSAKAGFTAFLSGLRNRLAQSGVHVVTVLPGFVTTKMTVGMALPTLLTAQPDEVAKGIYQAVRKQRDVLYVKPIWRIIMMIIRSLPERVFKRTEI